MATNQKSTRQLLDKIQNFPCLYRHTLNGTYYAIKKNAGKRKEHSLQTTDRKIAERKLAAWIKDLDKIDSTAEKTTLNQLLVKFVAGRKLPSFFVTLTASLSKLDAQPRRNTTSLSNSVARQNGCCSTSQ